MMLAIPQISTISSPASSMVRESNSELAKA
jgi:hypothetical protein